MERLGLAAHVMGQGAAAAHALGHHHLDPVAGQQPHRRLVDRGREHLLGAAAQQRDSGPARAFGGKHLGPVDVGAGRQGARRQSQHGAQAAGQELRKRPAEPGADQRQAETVRVRHEPGEQRAQGPVEPRPPVGFLDPDAGEVDQVHVVDPGGTGGHTRQAG
jgi:hypothetical protein